MLVLAALCLAGVLQQAPTPDFALLVKTANPEIAQRVTVLFAKDDPPAALPELAVEGSHYVLLVDSEGAVHPRTGQGDVGLVQLQAAPGVLMELFAEEAAGLKSMFQMVASMEAGQAGRDPKVMNEVIDELFAFPAQIGRVNFNVRARTDVPGYDAEVDAEPKAGSGFARVLAALKPASSKPPSLPHDDKTMELRLSVDPVAFRQLGAFWSRLIPRLLGSDAGSAAVIQKVMDLSDGTVAFATTASTGAHLVLGTTGAPALAELLHGAEYRRFVEMSVPEQLRESDAFQLGSLDHRGVNVLHQRIELDADSGQVLDQYTAVAGDYFVVSTAGCTEASARRLIDAALEDGIEREALGGSALLAFDLQPALMQGLRLRGGATPRDVPERVQVRAAVVQGSLRIHVQAK